MEDPIAEVGGAARVEAHGVGGVVGVGGVDAVEDDLLVIADAVAVGIADEPEVGGLHDEDPVVPELEAGGGVEIVEEGRAFVGAAVVVGVLEDEELVADLASGRAFRVAGPCGDPETAAGIPCHLDRVDEIGELFFVGEEIHGEPLVERDLGDDLLAGGVGV